MPETPKNIQPPMNPMVQSILEGLFALVPARYKRVVGAAGVAGTVVANHLGYLDGTWTLLLGAFFGSYAFVGLMHADMRTDANVDALAAELETVKTELKAKIESKSL